MRNLNNLMLVTMATLAVACGRSKSPGLDDALKNDLALASQAQGYNPQAFVSPTEAGNAAQPQYAPRTLQTSARQPSTATRRTSTVRRSSGSSGSSGSTRSGSGGYYPAPTPPATVEKHTVRDAAIGAAAGAILGASTSRDKMKGGIIGAAAGGLLGAVIGNSVDVHKRTGW
jgi:hypothetical protein